MIVTTDPADFAGHEILEVRMRGGVLHGLTLADQADLSAPGLARVTGSTVALPLNAADVTVPLACSGLTIENVGTGDGQDPHPVDMGLTVHWHRLLGQGSYIPQMWLAPGVYDFSRTLAALKAARARGCKTLLQLCYSPSWMTVAPYTNPADAHRSDGVAGSAGWAWVPADLAATMQADPRDNSPLLRDFLIALLTVCGPYLDALGTGNELNWRDYASVGSPYGNHFEPGDTGVLSDLTTVRPSVTGTQKYDRYVLVQACIYETVKAYDPNIIVIGPDWIGVSNTQASGKRVSAREAYGEWLGAGGAPKCDYFGNHPYYDPYQQSGIAGVNRHLVSMVDGMEAERVARGVPAKSWFCTEVGYNEMGILWPLEQRQWARRMHAVLFSKGYKAAIAYVWTSLNPSTQQMSFYLRSDVPGYGRGLRSGLQPIATEWSDAARLFSGKTMAAGAVQLSDGTVVCKLDGVTTIL